MRRRRLRKLLRRLRELREQALGRDALLMKLPAAPTDSARRRSHGSAWSARCTRPRAGGNVPTTTTRALARAATSFGRSRPGPYRQRAGDDARRQFEGHQARAVKLEPHARHGRVEASSALREAQPGW